MTHTGMQQGQHMLEQSWQGFNMGWGITGSWDGQHGKADPEFGRWQFSAIFNYDIQFLPKDTSMVQWLMSIKLQLTTLLGGFHS